MTHHEKRTVVDRQMFTEALRHMGEADLLFINKLIIERLHLIRQAKSTVALAQFSVGDHVAFKDNLDRWQFGVIEKLNKKTASVVTDQGERWKVSAGLLRKETP